MIINTFYWQPPIPLRQFDWSATLENYDGAPDSKTRHQIGYGKTKEEAIQDLIDLLAD